MPHEKRLVTKWRQICLRGRRDCLSRQFQTCFVFKSQNKRNASPHSLASFSFSLSLSLSLSLSFARIGLFEAKKTNLAFFYWLGLKFFITYEVIGLLCLFWVDRSLFSKIQNFPFLKQRLAFVSYKHLATLAGPSGWLYAVDQVIQKPSRAGPLRLAVIFIIIINVVFGLTLADLYGHFGLAAGQCWPLKKS